MSRPITLTALGLVLALGVASCAQQGPSGAEASVAAPMAALPARVDNFRLVTADGFAKELYRYKDASAVVLVMHGAGSAEIAKNGAGARQARSSLQGQGRRVLHDQLEPEGYARGHDG